MKCIKYLLFAFNLLFAVSFFLASNWEVKRRAKELMLMPAVSTLCSPAAKLFPPFLGEG